MGILALVVAVATWVVLVLGVRLFFALRSNGHASLASLLGVGVLAGSLPVIVLGWPNREVSAFGAAWFGHYVQALVAAKLRPYGWIQYAQGIVAFGLQGLLVATVFLRVWERGGGPDDVLKVET